MNKKKFRMILMIFIKSVYIYLSIQDLKWKKEVFDNYIIFVDGFCVLLSIFGLLNDKLYYYGPMIYYNFISMIYFGVKEGNAYHKNKILENKINDVLLNSTNSNNTKIPLATLIKQNLNKLKELFFVFINLLTKSSIEEVASEIGLKNQFDNIKNYLIQFRFTTINFLKFFVFLIFVILNELTYDYNQKKKQINKNNNKNNKKQIEKEKKD
jgi:hypothetical protein